MGFVSVSMLLLTVHTQRGKINFSFQGRSYCFRRNYQVHAGKGNDCGHEMIDGPSKKSREGSPNDCGFTGVLMDFSTCVPDGWVELCLLRMLNIPCDV